MKNSSDTIGNRTRDIPACSAMPQPTAPPRVHLQGGLLVFQLETSWFFYSVVYGYLFHKAEVR